MAPPLWWQDEYIPWGTLRYLIGEAMYGGRVSDSYDRRILTTYLDEYLGDFLFDTFQPFHFFQNKDVDISIPPVGGRDTYMASIEGLPLVQSPEVFGLHANADISYYTDATKAIWADLVDLQPRTGSGGAVSGQEGGKGRSLLLRSGRVLCCRYVSQMLHIRGCTTPFTPSLPSLPWVVLWCTLGVH